MRLASIFPLHLHTTIGRRWSCEILSRCKITLYTGWSHEGQSFPHAWIGIRHVTLRGSSMLTGGSKQSPHELKPRTASHTTDVSSPTSLQSALALPTILKQSCTAARLTPGTLTSFSPTPASTIGEVLSNSTTLFDSSRHSSLMMVRPLPRPCRQISEGFVVFWNPFLLRLTPFNV